MKRRFTSKDIDRLQAKGIKAKEVAPAAQISRQPEPENKSINTFYLIGIDPDVEKCGFAVKDKTTDTIIEVKALHFFDVINRINQLRQDRQIIVYVDAGWLISKSNWHKEQGSNRRERIAKNVGACHQVGKLLCEYFSRKGIKHYPIKPTKAKIGSEAFKKLNVWDGRVNQDCRDAVCLLLGR